MRIRLEDFFTRGRDCTVEIDLEEAQEQSPAEPADGPRGFFSELGQDRLGLFLVGENLHVLVNEVIAEASQVELVDHCRDGDRCELNMRLAGWDQRSIVYINSQRPVSTIFSSEDEEDADFGLWFSNVLNSAERKRICMEAWAARFS